VCGQLAQPLDDVIVPAQVHLGVDVVLDRLQAQLFQARQLSLAQ